MARYLSEIAKEILKDMQTGNKAASLRYPYAWPYLMAMMELNSIDDSYYADSAKSVILYFLANAASWKGETARRIKAELKELVK